MQLIDKLVLECKKTGYKAEIEFHGKVEVATAIDAEYLLYQTLDDLKRACMDAATCRGRGGGVRRSRCSAAS